MSEKYEQTSGKSWDLQKKKIKLGKYYSENWLKTIIIAIITFWNSIHFFKAIFAQSIIWEVVTHPRKKLLNH